MNPYLGAAVTAARDAGVLLREHFGRVPAVKEMLAHDIKIDLDLLSQELITERLLGAFPEHALYGEEGVAGNPESEWQWIVDPIDGTVNYFYGIPHFCISIALRRVSAAAPHGGAIEVGVIYDPMREEMWQVTAGGVPTLNGQPIRVSARTQLTEAMLSVGFAKSQETIASGLPMFDYFITRARKCRLMGSAALDLAYVACGRLDAYIESSVSLWDVAAGWLLVEAAGGKIEMHPRKDNPNKLSVRASSGRIDLDAAVAAPVP
jgi:myo-inositol-1(or 4)-monophosphatase